MCVGVVGEEGWVLEIVGCVVLEGYFECVRGFVCDVVFYDFVVGVVVEWSGFVEKVFGVGFD